MTEGSGEGPCQTDNSGPVGSRADKAPVVRLTRRKDPLETAAGGSRVLDEPSPERWFEGHPDLQEQVRRNVRARPGVRVASVLRAALIQRARTSPDAFIEYCFDKPNGEPARQGWMHRRWQRLWGKHRRLILVAPRLHWKTGQAVGRVIYDLGRNPNLVTKLLCQSDAKATKRLSVVREHLTRNNRVHQVFPWLRPPEKGRRDVEWNKHQITVQRTLRAPDPSIEALGITSSASGDRANLLVADDVVDRRNSISLPKVRQTIREAWDDWVNLTGPDGWILYLCTLWHNADLTHDLLANPEWAVAWYEITGSLGSYVRLPDGQDWESPEPLWGVDPECPIHGHEFHGIEPAAFEEYHRRLLARRWPADGPPPCELVRGGQVRLGESSCRCGPWTRKALETRRTELGSRKFARGFSNRPITDDERRVRPEWIRYYDGPVPGTWEIVIAIDTASSQGTRSDYTGVAVLAIEPIAGIVRVKYARHFRLTFPEKFRLVQELAQRFRPTNILIELAAGGRELAEALVLNTRLPVRGVGARASKVSRLDQVSPLLEAGRVEFPASMDPALPYSPDEGNLIRELLDLPLGEHEDIADAFVHALRFLSLVYDSLSLAVPALRRSDDPDDEDSDDEGLQGAEGSRVLIF